MRWTGNVAHIKEVKCAEKTSFGNLEGNRPHRELGNVGWIRLVQNRVQWQERVNSVKELQVS
jgi:hypothetical protein